MRPGRFFGATRAGSSEPPVFTGNDPLVAVAAPAAHRDVGAPVGVIDAGFAGGEDESGGKLADGQVQEPDGFGFAAIVEALLPCVVGAKVEMAVGPG